MAISTFASSAPEHFAPFAAFQDFAGFGVVPSDQKITSGLLHPQQPSPPMTTDGSPNSSGPGASDGPVLAGDDEDDDVDSGAEDLATNKRRGSIIAGPNGKRGKASSAERRATHNAIERARRESLNGRFLELAGALPTMANVKRPSKSVIVNKSLEWIYESQIREHALVRENNALRAELNDMRARLQMPPIAQPTSLPVGGDLARFKAAGGMPQSAGLGLGSGSPAPHASADGYFGTLGPFAPLTATHHPMQYPAFGPATHVPSSAPLPRSQPAMFAFNMPPQNDGLAKPGQGVAHPASPASKSDSGSETGQVSKSPTGGATVSPVADDLAPAAGSSIEAAQVSQANAMAALQAAHFQQQQFAAFAAAAAASQAGQVNSTAAVWPMGGGFMF